MSPESAKSSRSDESRGIFMASPQTPPMVPSPSRPEGVVHNPERCSQLGYIGCSSIGPENPESGFRCGPEGATAKKSTAPCCNRKG